MTEPDVQLPGEIVHWAVYHELQLPESSELQETVEAVIQSLRGHSQFQVDLKPRELRELLHSLSGMTLKQARQLVAYCILHDNRLSGTDIREVLNRKAQILR